MPARNAATLTWEQFNKSLYELWPLLNCDVHSYHGQSSNVSFECPKHGLQHKRGNRLLKEGCSQCAKKPFPLRRSKEWWVAKSQQIHQVDGKPLYDYSLVPESPGKNKPVSIICSHHGKFEQNFNNHTHGQGCPTCFHIGHLKPETQQRLDDSDWLQKQVQRKSIAIIAAELGTSADTVQRRLTKFSIKPMNTFKGGLEESTYEFLAKFGNPIRNVKGILPDNLELDFWFPKNRIAIECHGLRWHSFNRIETVQERHRHWQKWRYCCELDIRLFQIYESEWKHTHQREIWQHILCCYLDVNTSSYELSAISPNDANIFLKYHHFCKTSNLEWACGLVNRGEILSVMAFTKSNEMIATQDTQSNIICMWEFSQNEYLRGQPITSYSNNRWSDHKICPILGFKLSRELPPVYQYFKGQRIVNNIQHEKLKYNPMFTEAENMFRNGYRRIWDAGQTLWVWPNTAEAPLAGSPRV